MTSLLLHCSLEEFEQLKNSAFMSNKFPACEANPGSATGFTLPSIWKAMYVDLAPRPACDSFAEPTHVRTCVGGHLGHCVVMSLSTTILLALIAIVTATGETGE